MKKIKIISLVLVLLTLLNVFSLGVSAIDLGTEPPTEPDSQYQPTNPPVYAAFSGEDESITNGCRTVDAMIPLLGTRKMLDTTAACMLYEINSDTVVYSYNPDASIYPASLVKIMTTLLAIEMGDLSKVITVTQTALDAVPSTAVTVKLKPGEKLTLEQLLYCVMVGGGNDACTTVAEHISGSQAAFVAEMNKKARELGCTGTVFTNCHGVHDDAQVTTARDMTKIVREAVKNPEFKEILSTTIYRVAKTNLSEERRLEVSNLLMAVTSKSYYDARVTGGRTGILDDRRRSLISTVESGELSYIVVVLAAVPKFASNGYTVQYFGSYEETKVLIDLAFDGLEIRQTLSENQIYTQYPVSNGDTHVAVGPDDTQYIVLPKSLKFNDLTIRYNSAIETMQAPVSYGQKVSDIQLWYGNVCIAQSSLVAKHNVFPRSDTPLTEQGGEAFSTGGFLQAVGIAALIIGGIFAVLYMIRLIRTVQRNAQSRRRRRDRRRSR
ncbi:MAG: D-alanyl-D-alanine carboxypeptidase [Oscillospiraceae bacterium]|nr:D-alanyl-D-alanine carboxypeptidase [Oscillospiraceae bacterium]